MSCRGQNPDCSIIDLYLIAIVRHYFSNHSSFPTYYEEYVVKMTVNVLDAVNYGCYLQSNICYQVKLLLDKCSIGRHYCCYCDGVDDDGLYAAGWI